jgi:hypothetical protein
MANENLTKAKTGKNDEFYTQYHDIEREINGYWEYDPKVFEGKTILLPCDDPEWSNFTKFFAQNFERFKLKKLISTSYAPKSKIAQNIHHPTLFELNDEQFDKSKAIVNGKIFTLTKDNTGDGKIDVNDLEWSYLKGNGDYNSEEVKKLRDESDIIITNPPFSLFRDFLNWIFEANKKFVVVGSMNAITYKEVFSSIKQNKIWLGLKSTSKPMFFKTSDKEYALRVSNERPEGSWWRSIENEVHIGINNSCWYTNLDHGKRHQPFGLMTYEENLKFSKHKDIKGKEYQKYDNYNAIEVSYIDAIPSDYDGIMGVPISFLDKYSPEQFEIVGSDTDIKEGKLPELINPNWNGKFDRGYLNGNRIYSRIFIRHIKSNNN